MVNITELKFDAAGLIPAIVQDADTRVMLMQGYMNRESLVMLSCIIISDVKLI